MVAQENVNIFKIDFFLVKVKLDLIKKNVAIARWLLLMINNKYNGQILIWND